MCCFGWVNELGPQKRARHVSGYVVVGEFVGDNSHPVA